MSYGVDRRRARQGAAVVVDGVPYGDAASTLSLLPGAAVGEWLAANRAAVRGRLLDAGCGNQPFRSWYATLADRVVTLDAAPLAGIDVLGFADRLPFADGSFDTVLMTEVLEHVTDAEQAVADAYRVLSPGGSLLVTVPFIYPVHEAPYDFRRLTHLGLRSLLERHGFEVRSLAAKGGLARLAAHVAFLGAAQLLDGLGRRAGRHRLPTEVAPVRRIFAAPQQWIISRGRRRRVVGEPTGTAALVSLGYMAVGRRPTA